ncbi:MAG: diguanylate cyclase [Microthrixaceae bacterium]
MCASQVPDDDVWRGLLEGVADVVMTLDLHGRVLSRQATGSRLSDVSDDDVTDSLILPRVHPEDVPVLLQLWSKVAGRPGEILVQNARVRHATDHECWLTVTFAAAGLDRRSDGAVVALAARVDGSGPLQLDSTSSDGFSLAASAPVGLGIYSQRSALAWANESFVELSGREPGPTSTSERFEHPVIATLEQLAAAHRDPRMGSTDPVVVLFRGRTLRVDATPSGDSGDLLVSLQDISEQVAASAARARAEATFAAAFEHSQAGIAMVTTAGVFTRVNPAFTTITGYPEDELVGTTFQQITHPDDLALDQRYVAELLAGERVSYRMEKRYIRRDGDVVWVDLRVALVRGVGNTPLHFVANVVDISERRRTEQFLRSENSELTVRASHDHLTGLPNRRLLDEQLAMRSADLDDGGFVLICDVDGFKAVNDEHGHQTGDAVLTEIANRLRDCSREGDLVARIGGDEFAVLARLGGNEEAALRLGERLVDAVRQPITVGEATVEVGLSVGIDRLRPHLEVGESIRPADQALFEVKRHGGGALMADGVEGDL